MTHGDHSGRSGLQVWYCSDCRSVHMRTNNVCLSFSRREFVELSHAIVDIYHEEFDNGGDEPVVEPLNDDTVLESDLIS